MTDQPNYITPAGLQRLRDELTKLQSAERPKVVREVAEAAAQGDRSENAEYIYGKKRLREIDSRMRFLSGRLKNVEAIDPTKQKGERALFGAFVTLENEEGKEKTWQIVGEDESDPDNGRVSYKAPIGRAMMNKSEGDEVVVKRPDGTERTFVVLSVRFPTE